MIQIREYEINEARDAVDTGEVADLKPPPGTKPPVSYVSPAAETYIGRGHQGGEFKYAKGNYLRKPPEGISDLDSILGYADALKRHATQLCDSIIRYIGGGVGAANSKEEAVYAADKESGQAAAAHIGACFNILVQKAVDMGLLPEDPGPPRRNK